MVSFHFDNGIGDEMHNPEFVSMISIEDGSPVVLVSRAKSK